MKIIIHCGAYKTGSSSIQNFFHTRKNYILDNHRGFYPTAGLFFSKEIGYRHTKLFYSLGKPDWDKHTNDMKTQLLEAKKQGVEFAIISSEALSNPIIQRALREFIVLLKQWGFEDIRGIAYIRNLYGYILRHYREFTLRHKNQKKINGWIKKNQHVFDYPQAFCALHEIFKGRFELAIYEECSSTLDDFCQRIGMSNIDYSEPKRVNSGINALDIEINRLVNTKAIKHKGLRFASNLESQLGITFTDKVSEFPALLKNDDWIGVQNWPQFQNTFNFSDEQITTLTKRPDITDSFNVYELSKSLATFIDHLVA
ncbi:hypothetical protein [Kangiella shandongensis]|uniref:hypothetical protein n=1 Tax=Kangiella shandongensis TaxID=2763258 RepID=UPI001CC1B3B3|nr:hypothetical protein [Kangiella shandongensis]